MTTQNYSYVLVAHDGKNCFPVYSSNHETIVENIMEAVCIQEKGFNRIDRKKLIDFVTLTLNRFKSTDQLSDEDIPESPDWRIHPTHLLKELEKDRGEWNMFLLTVPTLNF